MNAQDQLAEQTRQFQAQLEHVRACEEHGTDDVTLGELREDLELQRSRMEIAWLECCAG